MTEEREPDLVDAPEAPDDDFPEPKNDVVEEPPPPEDDASTDHTAPEGDS